jgi:hypothetical protein
MKKIVLHLLIVFSVNCFAQKKINNFSDGNISINYPKSWKEHPKEFNIDPEKIISFYPKRSKSMVIPKGKIPSSTFTEFYKSKILDSISLQQFIQKRLILARNKLDNISDIEISSINSKYGEIKILNIEYSLFSKNIKLLEYNLKYNNHIYSFYFHSLKKEHKKYLEEAKSIFDSFEIIE